ncbi:hypothetical protein [Weissella soli]|jgi:hypothetical protein|uniref:Uncharacterized protein n=1 Tax=Weissella soli TaxID=155866 RepID=A0A288QSA0_9LACO|nr:hypothetical protein [Weissella soli]AOT55828.1 hypothetical protein WSWS_00175 [Weissella soli]RDL06498.1 hypothetical protein DFP99_0876 [Weissella soli]GEN93449.1 hypothetical protein WSO01_10610 [Weissella soli]GJM47698.1 hypothetical protein WSSLDB02_02550 [Weissella soli]
MLTLLLSLSMILPLVAIYFVLRTMNVVVINDIDATNRDYLD